ncbi:hypothetical protein GW796_08600 [archaeon]|nr:hypothetical protein [archaeon]
MNLINDFNITDPSFIKEIKNKKNHRFPYFFASIKTYNGVFNKTISFQMNPIIFWIITSTLEDSLLRTNLAKKFGYLPAIKKLSAIYPYGAKKDLESRITLFIKNMNL